MENQSVSYGVDRKQVEAAMRRARRERSEALRAIFRRLFKRPAGEAPASHCDGHAAPLAHR